MSDKETLYRYYRGKVRGIDPENFTADVLISDGSVDRHGTIIEPTAWKKDIQHYKNHPILVACHNHWDLLGQIGEAVKLKFTEEGPVAKFKWYAGEGNPQADWGWKLAEKGIAMFSVGFIPYEFENLTQEGEEKQKKKDPSQVAWRKYTRVELAEVSQVVVGSNRNALQRFAESLSKETLDTQDDIDMVIQLANEILDQIKEIPEGEDMVAMSDEDFERPYPNYHACRLRDPGDFQKGKYVTQKRKHDGKEYTAILGRLKGEKTLTEQSYRYHRSTWTEKEARSHCKDHKGILFEPATGEGGKSYEWQCVECGLTLSPHETVQHEIQDEENSDFISCPECSGEMRRREIDEISDRKLETDQTDIFEKDDLEDEILVRFAGSPRNPFGAHCSFRFKGGAGGYKKAWTLHFSQIGSGSTSPKASGPIRGTIRRIAMIAAGMKPKCAIAGSDGIGPRSGGKSPLAGTYPQKPSDYGLKEWLKPGDENVDAEKALRFTCGDLNIIKRIAVQEVKRRIKDREEKKEKDFSREEIEFFEWLYDWEASEASRDSQSETLRAVLLELSQADRHTRREIADLFGLKEDGEGDGSRETPPEPESQSVYESVLADDPGEREGDGSGLESVIGEVGKLKARLRGEKGFEDLQALVHQITKKEKEND